MEDQIVDRLLFGHAFRAEVNHFTETTSKTGWSPLPGGYSYFNSTFNGHVLATDASAFDWTVQNWMVAMLYDTLMDRTRGNTESYKRMAFNRIQQVLGPECVVRLPNGRRFRQRVFGVMKSGWLLTLMANTNVMLASSLCAWARAAPAYFEATPDGLYPDMPLSWGMGDDVIMKWDPTLSPEPYVRELNRTGLKVKQYSHEREFAGFRIQPSSGDQQPTVTPIYTAKHMTMIAYTPRERLEEMAIAYGLIYALSDSASPQMKKFIDDYSPYGSSYFEHWARGQPLPGNDGPRVRMQLDNAYALARTQDQ